MPLNQDAVVAAMTAMTESLSDSIETARTLLTQSGYFQQFISHPDRILLLCIIIGLCCFSGSFFRFCQRIYIQTYWLSRESFTCLWPAVQEVSGVRLRFCFPVLLSSVNDTSNAVISW